MIKKFDLKSNIIKLCIKILHFDDDLRQFKLQYFNHYNNNRSKLYTFCLGFIVDYEDYVIVYIDGACPFNGHPYARGGIGVWFGNGHPL